MTYALKGSGYNYSLNTSSGTWTWSVDQTTDPSSPEPIIVKDIRSPFGRLDQVQFPIPGSVMTAIYESIQDFQQFLYPDLTFASGSPTSLSITVTQGDPVTAVGLYSITNSGSYGSSLNVSNSVTNSYLSVSPATAGGITKYETSNVQVYVNPLVLSSLSSPYTAAVISTSTTDPSDTLSVPVVITVLPQPTIDVEFPQFYLTYDRTSGTYTTSVTQNIENVGPASSLLTVFISKVINSSPWLSISANTIQNLGSGDVGSFTLDVVSACLPGLDGVYSEVVRVYSSNSTNGPVYFNVALTVTS